MASIRRYFRFPKVIKKFFFVFSFLLIFDVLIASLGVAYLRDKISFFSGRSEKMLLSDLLFLEGAMIFGVGAFVASGMTWLFTSLRYLRDRYHSKEKTSADIRKPPKKQITGIFMLIIGTSLIGLSIVISVLPI